MKPCPSENFLRDISARVEAIDFFSRALKLVGQVVLSDVDYTATGILVGTRRQECHVLQQECTLGTVNWRRGSKGKLYGLDMW